MAKTSVVMRNLKRISSCAKRQKIATALKEANSLKS